LTADVSAVLVADAPLTLPIAAVRRYLAAKQMTSKLQILKADDRNNDRQTEMITYLDYTDILLYNDNFLSQIFRVKASKTQFHFHHNFRLLFVFYI
jgi:hypothetical protein